MWRRIGIILTMLPLAGCSAPEGSQREKFVPNRPFTGIVYDTVTGSVEGAWKAALTPLEDLNIKKTPIPDKLQKISDNPYSYTAPVLCDSLRQELAELDALLGPDVCTQDNPTGAPPNPLPWRAVDICTPKNPTGVSKKGAYVDRGANMARQRAINEVSGKVNVIPFRSVVRYAAGAEKHARELERAYQAGKLRRAFLKGLQVSLGPECVNRSMNATVPPAMTPLPAH